MKITATINDLNGFVDNLNEWDAREILYHILIKKEAEEIQKTLLHEVWVPRIKDFLGWDEDKLLDCIPQTIITFYLKKNGYEVKKLQQNKKEKC